MQEVSEVCNRLRRKLQLEVKTPEFGVMITSESTANKSAIQHVSRLLIDMKQSSIKRGHDAPEFVLPPDFLEFLISLCADQQLFEITMNNGTIVKFGFVLIEEIYPVPVAFSNGLFCSASPERIDNSKGYTRENIKLFPLCMNGTQQFTTIGAMVNSALTPSMNAEEMKLFIMKIINSDKHNTLYTKSEGAKLRCVLHHMKESTKNRKQSDSGDRAEMKEHVEFNFKTLLEFFVSHGFRCAITFARLEMLGNKGALMISVDRLNSAVDNYSPSTCRPVCSAFNSGKIGGKLNDKEAAKCTSMSSAYWKFIVGTDIHDRIQQNYNQEIENFTKVSVPILEQYDERGYIDLVPSYLELVLKHNKVVGPTKAATFYDSKDLEEKKRFGQFVKHFNGSTNAYKRQRTELRSKCPLIDAYFARKTKFN
jgi:hypothetical protein